MLEERLEVLAEQAEAVQEALLLLAQETQAPEPLVLQTPVVEVEVHQITQVLPEQLLVEQVAQES